MEREELVEEMKRRWMKPGKKKKEEIIDLLEREDRGQRRIVWVKQDKEEDNTQKTELREDMSVKEERRGGQTTHQDSGVEEDEWEDMIPVEEDSQTRSESVEVDNPVSETKRRPRSVSSPGRPRGKGRRGYWVAKREEHVKGKTKSKLKGE